MYNSSNKASMSDSGTTGDWIEDRKHRTPPPSYLQYPDKFEHVSNAPTTSRCLQELSLTPCLPDS